MVTRRKMKGILFRPEMIPAIVNGSKTQTRRVIKPQPVTDGFDGYEVESGLYHPAKVDKYGELYPGDAVYGMWSTDGELGWVARYQPGETVYIKEAWWQAPEGDVYYKADWIDIEGVVILPITDTWRSPMFMPAWAARYFIRILSVTPQRLQEITEEDCLAEGIEVKGFTEDGSQRTPIDCYQWLWDSINPKYPWSSNPWVWQYTFQLIKKEGK